MGVADDVTVGDTVSEGVYDPVVDAVVVTVGDRVMLWVGDGVGEAVVE